MGGFMGAKTLFNRCCRKLAELRAANGANVTVAFALAAVPMVGFVGAAVDYSHGNSVKAAMQGAADSTALMLAKTIAAGGATLTKDQINQKAFDYFSALLNRKEVLGLKVTATYTSSGRSAVLVGATASVKADFMGMIGISALQIGATAQSVWGGNAKMQVALALDNTGSMAEWNKMGALKTATHSLLDQLKAVAANPNDVNVAIIPFSKDVNMGATQANIVANLIDWADWDLENGSDIITQVCTKVVGKKGKTTNKCASSTSWKPAPHTSWNGCITDRDQPYDVQNTKTNPLDISLPPIAASTLFPAEQYDGCPIPMMGLSHDWTALNSVVDQMTPNGDTNQAIGLAWAWQALSPGPPMNAPAKGPDVQQVLILLTDGLNTQNRWYSDQAAIDARQKILCANVKAAGITLYTVQVNVGFISPLSTLLQECASKPEYFFHLTSAGEVASVFNTIGTNLSMLRIAQ
jgi:Flp pilus assembly protein TadG